MKTIFKGLDRLSRSLPMLVTVLMLGLVVEASITDFCWRDSFGRGVGKIPKGGCGPGQDHIGALCYDKCPKGMKRFGFDCHSVCPPGSKFSAARRSTVVGSASPGGRVTRKRTSINASGAKPGSAPVSSNDRARSGIRNAAPNITKSVAASDAPANRIAGHWV